MHMGNGFIQLLGLDYFFSGDAKLLRWWRLALLEVRARHTLNHAVILLLSIT